MKTGLTGDTGVGCDCDEKHVMLGLEVEKVVVGDKVKVIKMD